MNAAIEIDEVDGVTAVLEFRTEHAPALARAFLEAAGLNPWTVFLGELPDLDAD